MLSEVEMPELPLQILEEGNKSLGEVGVLEWRSYVMLEDPPEDYVSWDGVEDAHHSPRVMGRHL